MERLLIGIAQLLPPKKKNVVKILTILSREPTMKMHEIYSLLVKAGITHYNNARPISKRHIMCTYSNQSVGVQLVCEKFHL